METLALSDVRLCSTKSAVVIVAVDLGLSPSSLQGFAGVDIPADIPCEDSLQRSLGFCTLC